jgi:hypothetical protein
MTEDDNEEMATNVAIPRERFRDGDIKWPKARKEPKVEPSEGWAFFEDRPERDSEPEDEIGYEGER